jgi:flagellar basal-body rod protein FlgB
VPDNSFIILEHILTITGYRQQILASNIANADTPGYKAKDISFQSELGRAVEAARAGQRPNTAKAGNSYEVFESSTTLPNRDGNTVNLDIEMAKAAENTLMHNAATQFYTFKVRMLKDALQGGK